MVHGRDVAPKLSLRPSQRQSDEPNLQLCTQPAKNDGPAAVAHPLPSLIEPLFFFFPFPASCPFPFPPPH